MLVVKLEHVLSQDVQIQQLLTIMRLATIDDGSCTYPCLLDLCYLKSL